MGSEPPIFNIFVLLHVQPWLPLIGRDALFRPVDVSLSGFAAIGFAVIMMNGDKIKECDDATSQKQVTHGHFYFM